MGSEQHAASLKNRLYKQKNPGRFTPSGVFFISALPPHAAGCRPQGFAAAAAGRRGRRRCNTTQRQTRPVPESAEKSADSKKMKAIDLSERQKQILAYMDAGVEYSTEQVAEKIGLKGPRTRQLLNELVNMELLACIGTTKRRRYIKV